MTGSMLGKEDKKMVVTQTAGEIGKMKSRHTACVLCREAELITGGPNQRSLGRVPGKSNSGPRF